MSNNKNIEKNIMDQISSGKIAMKPRWYFVVGAFLAMLGLIGSFFTAIFFTNILFFLSRHVGGQGQWKLDMALSSFPLWVPLLALMGLSIGIILLRKFDFSYRKNFVLIVAVAIISVLLGSYLLDKSGVNDIWSVRGPMRGLYYELNQSQTSDSPGQYGRGRGKVKGVHRNFINQQ